MSGRIVFHDRYWRDVSKDARDFILTLLHPDPAHRVSSEEALKHPWLKGESASDRDLLPEIRAYNAKARLRRGIEIIKLANRIDALKMQEDDEEDIPSPADMAASADAGDTEPFPSTSPNGKSATGAPADGTTGTTKKRSLSKIARGAIFREVVLAKVREVKQNEERERIEREARDKSAAHA